MKIMRKAVWILFAFGLLDIGSGSTQGKISQDKHQSDNNTRLITKTARIVKSVKSSAKEDSGRYAIHFITAPEGGNHTATTHTTHTPVDDMAASAIVDMMSHIKDPFKHGVTSAVLAGLYIAALISLIVFATTGSIAFICSFSDCRNFFLGIKPEASPRPFDGSGGSFAMKKRGPHHIYPWNDAHMPVVQALHDSFDKFGRDN